MANQSRRMINTSAGRRDETPREGSHVYHREGTCSRTRLCEYGCSETVPRQVEDGDTEYVDCEVGKCMATPARVHGPGMWYR